MINGHSKVKALAISALLAAIICITTTSFHIPVGVNGGYVHVGDAFIYIAASILPLPYAMMASAIGAGLADLISGAAVWVIPTIIIKPILVLFFTRKKENILCKRNILAVFLAGFTGVILYCLAEYIMYGNFLAAFYMSFITLVQPVGSGLVFVMASLALDKVKFKSKVFLKEV